MLVKFLVFALQCYFFCFSFSDRAISINIHAKFFFAEFCVITNVNICHFLFLTM